MNEHGFTRENLLGSLPVSLSGDPKMAALAEAIAGVLAKRREEIRGISIYPRISELDEGLLDILARDFKVDWWDNDYSLEEKRRTLLSSWQVHKLLGTKAAVELAASAVYPITTVQEWFEYGGEPYYFRLNVQLSEGVWDNGKHKRLMQRLQYYKNLRSWLEPVVYLMPAAVLKNAQAFYFTSLLARFPLPGARPLLSSHELLCNASIANLDRICVGIGASLKICLPQSASFQGLAFLTHVNNWGEDVVRLDGRRNFDGSWLLDQGLRHGLSLQSFRSAYRQENRETAQVGAVIQAMARGEPSLGARAVYRAKKGNRAGGTLRTVRFPCRVLNTQGVRAARTADTMWTFDGSYKFDGSRKFNAGTERSEL